MKIAPWTVATSGKPDPRLATALSRLFIAGLGLAIGLLLAGVILTVTRPGVAVSRESSITDLPRALAALDPGGLFDLGLLILLATPAAGVVVLLVAFAWRRSWLFSAISLLVLVILALSAFLGLRS